MKQLAILGSTGSIGQQTLSIVERCPDKFQIYALTANTNVELILSQCIKYKPSYAVMQNKTSGQQLKLLCEAANLETIVLSGEAAIAQVCESEQVTDVIMGIVGFAGLKPTMAAVETGKTILLANKEVFVAAGDLFKRALAVSKATILPLDSEHHGLQECLNGTASVSDVANVTLTASGGPCLSTALTALDDVTPEQACSHPNWSMGRKISIDSATLVNKAFEVIEAHYLFGLPYSKIQAVIHPQSTVHAMVTFIDGSVVMQAAHPDMRLSISRGLHWPERHPLLLPSLSSHVLSQMTFNEIDRQRFPSFYFILEQIELDANMGVIINAANEIAVAAFLAQQIRFTDIDGVIKRTCQASKVSACKTIATIVQHDQEARQLATAIINRHYIKRKEIA